MNIAQVLSIVQQIMELEEEVHCRLATNSSPPCFHNSVYSCRNSPEDMESIALPFDSGQPWGLLRPMNMSQYVVRRSLKSTCSLGIPSDLG